MFWRNFSKVVLWIYLIIGVIGAIALAGLIGSQIGGGFFIFLIIVAVVFISASMFGLLIEMADNLAELTQMGNSPVRNNFQTAVSAPPSKSSNNRLSLSFDEKTETFWTCRHCGSRNGAGARFCKDCGTDR